MRPDYIRVPCIGVNTGNADIGNVAAACATRASEVGGIEEGIVKRSRGASSTASLVGTRLSTAIQVFERTVSGTFNPRGRRVHRHESSGARGPVAVIAGGFQ